jgi:hypothetical protein
MTGRDVKTILAFLLFSAAVLVGKVALATELEPEPAGLKKIQYNITIQVNVLRICASDRLYDFIEADYDGSGPLIKPYLVEAMDNKGQPVTCKAQAEIDLEAAARHR